MIRYEIIISRGSGKRATRVRHIIKAWSPFEAEERLLTVYPDFKFEVISTGRLDKKTKPKSKSKSKSNPNPNVKGI